MFMIILSAVGFLRTIGILLLVYYGFKMVMRFLAPKLVEKAAQKIYNDMQQRQSNASSQSNSMRRGDITINYPERKPKQYGRAEGDYIEYEEIDDK